MQITEKDFQGFIEGHHPSFEIIFRQYYKILVSFAMRYKIENMEAEDLVIELMYRIWEMRKNIKSPAALHCLFFTSLHNRVLNVLRDQKRHGQAVVAQLPGEEEFYGNVMEEEVSCILDQAIETLPPQCRQVILLLLEGKSVAEIADEMGISVNSVKTYKLRAVEILRVLLKDSTSLLYFIIFHIEYSE